MKKAVDRLKSEQIYHSLKQIIPAGVNSPVRSFPGLEMTPLVVESAFADTLIDLDGNEYIDYCLSWGALICGHAHPTIVEAVIKRVANGTSYGCTTAIEEKLARKVTECVPSIEKVRFVSSGTEACMSAVRLARGATKRRIVIKFQGGYHGHADSFLVQAGSGVTGLNGTSTSSGVPKEYFQWTACLAYNDIEAFEQFVSDPEIGEDLACVIIEPIATNMGLVQASAQFLQYLRKRCTELGALLLFDEVVSGFRVCLGGAQALYGITPDLTCLGKIVGGGFPAACFGGKKEIMDHLAPLGSVYQAGTLSGNPIAMEAGFQMLSLLQNQESTFYAKLEEKTKSLTDPIQKVLQENDLNASLQRVGSCFTLFFGTKKVTNAHDALKCDTTRFGQFFRYLFARGIYISPSQFEISTVSSVHTEEHLQRTKEVCLEYLQMG